MGNRRLCGTFNPSHIMKTTPLTTILANIFAILFTISSIALALAMAWMIFVRR